jgi:hypothetical protein
VSKVIARPAARQAQSCRAVGQKDQGDTNMSASRFSIAAGVIAFFALLVVPMAAQAATASGPSNEVAVAAVVHKGDSVIVNTNDAPLMVGSEVLARLPSGQKLTVTAIQDTWVGTSVKIDGKSLSGWVRSTDVMLARTHGDGKSGLADSPVGGHEKADASETLTPLKPAAAEVKTQPARECVVVLRPECYTAEPFRTSGFYDYYWNGHFEPDPDTATWEPWRHGY